MKYFLLGAIGYPLLEILWRRRTHYSMSIAGGLSCLLISKMQKLPITRATRSIVCGMAITALEYTFGQIWNRRYQVWDYRKLPLNVKGQICAGYTALWCLLSYGALSVLDTFRK